MINNKILTVSYGTFSCTLEGFDDSFGTMKAIAEYFRDLSADDRYFGAEPAQPDAQMLARIAQREISRHVEARQDDGRIVLSAQSDPAQAAQIASDTLDDVATAVADAAASAPVEMPQDAVKAAQPAARMTPTAKIVTPAGSRRTATIVKTQTAPKPATDLAETVQPAPDADAAPRTKEESRISAETDIVPSLPDEDVEAFFAERAPALEPASVIDDADTSAERDRARADSIADKLKRIRAVVSQQSDAAQTPDYSEDQHADATVTPVAKITEDIADEEDDSTSSDVLATTLRDLEDALEADDEFEDAEGYDLSDESEDDDIAAILSRLESEAPDPQQASDTHIDAHGDDDSDGMDENILAAMDPGEADEITDDNLFDEDESAASAPGAEPEPAPQPSAETPATPRTRVLKVKRATLEAVIASGQLEEYDQDEDAEAPPRKAPLVKRSSLSDEAEEDLARELAELEADMKAGDATAAKEETPADAQFEDDGFDEDDDYDDGDVEDESAASVAEDPAPPQSNMHPPADEDLSRLIEESKQQMDEPEAATRRDAFAHLRAAVASKKADEAAGDAPDATDSDEAYREDLANVVRPRRPVSGGEGARTQRPGEARPAPLKLVAEQRIDVAQPQSAAPIRPRRVSAVAPVAPVAASNAVETAGTFCEFATEMGAVKLPDLLEAAAAYLSFVEGHEEFSRPQLMTKVRQVETEDFTREDSLRSFGQLLREGKIEKLSGGRFQASDQIGFKPDARAAG
jgi:hypothetical protein